MTLRLYLNAAYSILVFLVCSQYSPAQTELSTIPSPSLCSPRESADSGRIHFRFISATIDSLAYAKEARGLHDQAVEHYDSMARAESASDASVGYFNFVRGIKGAESGFACSARVLRTFRDVRVEESIRIPAQVLTKIFEKLSESEKQFLGIIEKADATSVVRNLAEHSLASDRTWKFLVQATGAAAYSLVGFADPIPDDATLGTHGFSWISEPERAAALKRLKEVFGEDVTDGPKVGQPTLEASAGGLALTLDTTIKQILAREGAASSQD